MIREDTVVMRDYEEADERKYTKGDTAMAWHGKLRPGLLLLLFSFVVISEATAKALEIRYETAYACEGKILKIECKEGELIKLIRANYGRFSITICNDHGNTDWSVNCMSPKSSESSIASAHKTKTAAYQQAQACLVTLVLGHTNILKLTINVYLPPMWSTPRSAAQPHSPTAIGGQPGQQPHQPASRPSSSPQPPQAAAMPMPMPPATKPPITSEEEEDDDVRDIPEEITTLPPTTVRSIYWNWTKANTAAVQPCPGGTTGFAKWPCQMVPGGRPRWYPPNPDLSECRSVWLTSLEQRIINGKDPLISITSDLAQKMTEKMNKDIQTIPDTRQREQIVTEMLMDVAKTGSNLLDASQHPSWKDLSYKEQMSVATSLLIGLEENAFLLADTVTILSVRVLDTKSLTTEKFPADDIRSEWKASNDSIELPKGALIENSDGNLVRLVFVAFDRLEEILQWQPDSVTEPVNPENVTKILNSKVISASLGKGRHIQLKEPVMLTLKHIKTENVSNPTCVFWDYTTNSWSEEGCRVELSLSNVTHTVCYCDHLTNFAVLMDVRAIYLPIPHEIALQIITYVGCIISIVCLVLAIITFQLFRGLKLAFSTTFFYAPLRGCSLKLYVMLIEVFEAEKSRVRWYYFFAYSLPFLIVFISATVYPQGYGTPRHCWLQTDHYFIYSFVGPVLVVILLNLVFLTMAIVMMCRHASNSVSMKNKEHSRLAMFLLGLTWTFGFLYLIQESVAMAYLFAALNSFQGFFIFLFHCLQNEKYRKFVRRHSWMPRCLRCSKLSGASSSTASTGLAKERRTSLHGGSNGNPSGGSNSHSTDNSVLSPHGTSVGTTNSIVISNNLNNARPTALVQILSINNASTTMTNHNRLHNVSQQVTTKLELPEFPSPDVEPNTSTLPYIRNLSKHAINNPNIPKSVSTWGPLQKSLHWKNISFKSCSRDSGHGGSEQEDSPRSHTVVADLNPHIPCNTKDPRQMMHSVQDIDFNPRQEAPIQPKHLALPQTLHGHRKKTAI
nr:unnamed protein product [Callosobruchus chinensis]